TDISRCRPPRHRPLGRPALEISEAGAEAEVADDEADVGNAPHKFVARNADVTEKLVEIERVGLVKRHLDAMPPNGGIFRNLRSIDGPPNRVAVARADDINGFMSD